MDNKKLKKLPQWAQIEIARLQSTNEGLRQQIAEFTGKSETNTYLSQGLEQVPLPKNSVVDFVIGEHQEHKVSVRINSIGVVDINADSRTLEMPVIMPRASNSFYIKFVD